ncbi:MAG: S1 RNA-binding domain-containing protein [Chloroflexota bacterium]
MDHSEELRNLLTEAGSIPEPKRGDLLQGRVIAADAYGMIVDLGLKRDGLVPRADLELLPPEEAGLKVGDPVSVMVVETLDADGNLVVSIAQARESGDWLRAQSLLESDGVLEAVVGGYNRGGLIIPFGRLRGFVPASHITDLPRGLDDQGQADHMSKMVDKVVPLKVIEVDPRRRRLVLSERKAIRQWRQDQKARVIDQLQLGEVRTGVVTSLREFGAFVDIGGADGLIHISEMSWNRVEDPSEILRVGQEVQTNVIRLDKETSRIGLSLKRLQPNPWEAAAAKLEAGQELEGVVSRFVPAGVYVRIDLGIDGLLKSTEGLAGVSRGEKVQVRVTSFEPEKERLDLQWAQQTNQVENPSPEVR